MKLTFVILYKNNYRSYYPAKKRNAEEYVEDVEDVEEEVDERSILTHRRGKKEVEDDDDEIEEVGEKEEVEEMDERGLLVQLRGLLDQGETKQHLGQNLIIIYVMTWLKNGMLNTY